jgi:hypothetical protein
MGASGCPKLPCSTYSQLSSVIWGSLHQQRGYDSWKQLLRFQVKIFRSAFCFELPQSIFFRPSETDSLSQSININLILWNSKMFSQVINKSVQRDKWPYLISNIFILFHSRFSETCLRADSLRGFMVMTRIQNLFHLYPEFTNEVVKYRFFKWQASNKHRQSLQEIQFLWFIVLMVTYRVRGHTSHNETFIVETIVYFDPVCIQLW